MAILYHTEVRNNWPAYFRKKAMEWSMVRTVLGRELEVPGIYVISEFQNRGPYKVGLALHRLDKRLSNFQTCFRRFYVYQIVAFAQKKERAAEALMHQFLSREVRGHRLDFPSGRKSEWFYSSHVKLHAALKHLKEAGLPSLFGYGFWKGEPKLDLGWVNFDQPARSRAGRAHKPTYHAHPLVGNIDFR